MPRELGSGGREDVCFRHGKEKALSVVVVPRRTGKWQTSGRRSQGNISVEDGDMIPENEVGFSIKYHVCHLNFVCILTVWCCWGIRVDW